MRNMHGTGNPLSERSAHIGPLALAVPPFSLGQADSAEFLINAFRGRLTDDNLVLISKLFNHPGIMKRHFAIDSPLTFLHESQDEKIERFTKWSVDLSERAILDALDRAGLTRSDIAALIVNTCTGYICPGLSTYLIERLGLDPRTRAFDLVGSGCGGAVPNILLAANLVRGGLQGAVVSVAVEICTATFQMGGDLSLLVSNALFGDGAAAAIVWDRPEGLEILDSASYFVPENRDSIRYVYRNGQLHNQLSRDLPGFVRKAVARVVGDLLGSHGLRQSDIGHWALHPGGANIIRDIKNEMGLSETNLKSTRKVLAEYGNMSSPTVLFVLDDIVSNGIRPGELCVMVAFGAGLSAHSFLLRKAGQTRPDEAV